MTFNAEPCGGVFSNSQLGTMMGFMVGNLFFFTRVLVLLSSWSQVRDFMLRRVCLSVCLSNCQFVC